MHQQVTRVVKDKEAMQIQVNEKEEEIRNLTAPLEISEFNKILTDVTNLLED